MKSSLALATALAIALAAAGCSSGPKNCSNDDDCFDGQACSSEGVCVSDDGGADTGTTDASDASSGDDTSPVDTDRPDPDTGRDDTSTVDSSPPDSDATDTGEGTDTGVDDTTSTADTGMETDGGQPTCADTPGLSCDNEEFEFANDDTEACALKDLNTIGDGEKNDACGDVKPGCSVPELPDSNSFDATLCPDDPKDKYEIRVDQCKNFKRKVTIEIQADESEYACDPGLYKIAYKDSMCDGEENPSGQAFSCRLTNDATKLEIVIENVDVEKTSSVIYFRVEPDCEDEGVCPVQLDYTVDVTVEEYTGG